MGNFPAIGILFLVPCALCLVPCSFLTKFVDNGNYCAST